MNKDIKTAKQRKLFEEFVLKYTGRDMEYHTRYQTTGLEFAWLCWHEAIEQKGKSA